MSIRLGVVMDPIESIKIKKDSTFAMLLAAQQRGWEILYMQQADLYLRDVDAFAAMRPVSVKDDAQGWFALDDVTDRPLHELDVILMRKDPPFDMEYIYTTYLLEMAEQRGTLVVNRPQALRDCNEKLFIAQFPQCTTPMLVSRDSDRLRGFIGEYRDVILKPLDGMGGASVFRLRQDDPNISVVIETLGQNGAQSIMAQRFIPEISDGDKRILMVNGKPVPYSLARIPAKGETRGNLAAGGSGEGRPLTERDRWIADQVGPTLKEKGILFAGLDVIGDYLTEINVTSPTCIRELDVQFGLDIAGDLMNVIASELRL